MPLIFPGAKGAALAGGLDPLKRDLVYFFKLDEASGLRRDSSPNGFSATDNNTVGQGAGRAGIGFAADFERDNSESLTVGDAPLLRLGAFDFSWSWWFNQEAAAAALAIFFGKDTGLAGGDRREYLAFINSAGVVRVDVWQGTDATFLGELDSGAIASPTGAWHHVAVWYDSASRVLSGSVDNGTTFTVTLTGQPAPAAATTELVLGDRTSAPEFGFDGLLDAVGFWRRQLTDAERTRLYNGGNGLEWPFR